MMDERRQDLDQWGREIMRKKPRSADREIEHLTLNPSKFA